jgi:hypothetical protein
LSHNDNNIFLPFFRYIFHIYIIKYRNKNIKKFKKCKIILGIGDWGLGIGDWGLGPIPNPQSPIPIDYSQIIFNYIYLIFK